MNKELVSSLLKNNHYLRTGVFFIGALSSLGFLAKNLGEYRYAFLFGLLFVPLLIIEFIVYHLITSELRHKKTIRGNMRVGRMSIIFNGKNRIGVQFEGIIDSKVKILKYYVLDEAIERIMNNLSRYKVIEFEYYKRSGIVNELHPVGGE